MYLKSDKLRINLNGVEFTSGSARKERPNLQWEMILDDTAIEGWYHGVDVRRDVTARPNQWGDFTEPARLGARYITLTGTAVAITPTGAPNSTESSVRGLQNARDAFTSIGQAGVFHEMSVATSTDTRYISVGLSGTPSWVRMSDTTAVWKLELYAPNPRIYGPESKEYIGQAVTIGGLVYPLSYPINYGTGQSEDSTFTNDGNSPSWPKFEISGNYFSGFHIKNNLGSVVTYMGMVTAQSPVIIDMAKGTATQNGVDRSTDLSSRDWFSIGPKQTIRPTFQPIGVGVGSGSCAIIYRDTWI